jgi:hypothetical protein
MEERCVKGEKVCEGRKGVCMTENKTSSHLFRECEQCESWEDGFVDRQV